MQSIVDQVTDFDFEVIVGEDCSIDGTRAIVQEFAEKYPGIVKPIFHQKNVGGTQNYFAVHKTAQGEYIAHMDGDDYALPGKLAISAETLDLRSDVNVVWHRMEVIDDNAILNEYSQKQLDKLVNSLSITQDDLLRYGSLGFHSSMMYRRFCLSKIEYNNEELLDYYFAVRFLDSGFAVNLPKVLGGYRYNIKDDTASKKKNCFFEFSLVKKLKLLHLKRFSIDYPESRQAIFSNSLLNFIADLKNLRPTAFGFALLSLQLFSLSELFKFPSYVSRIIKNRSL